MRPAFTLSRIGFCGPRATIRVVSCLTRLPQAPTPALRHFWTVPPTYSSETQRHQSDLLEEPPEPKIPREPKRPRLKIKDFWATIDAAWAKVPNAKDARAVLYDPHTSFEARDAAHRTIQKQLPRMIKSLETILMEETSARLTAWDYILERRLNCLDNVRVWMCIGGSDDGFLYNRGYVVAVGKGYYDLVRRRPELGGQSSGRGAEEICYLGSHIHDNKYGCWPPEVKRVNRVSCESFCNPKGGFEKVFGPGYLDREV